MYKKTYRICSIVILMVVVCLFASCSNLITALLDEYYAEEELLVTGNRNFGDYIYSDKVHVHLSYDEGGKDDVLSLKVIDDEYWIVDPDCYYEILVEDFSEVAWNDFMLFIRVDETYYTFDIKSYEVPQKSELPKNKKEKILYDKFVPEYKLNKYNKKEFTDKYPEYKQYEWYSY